MVLVAIEETVNRTQQEVTGHTVHFAPLGFPLYSTCLRPSVHDSPKQGCWQWWCYLQLDLPQTSLSGTQSFWYCMQTPSSHFPTCSHCPYTCTPWTNTIKHKILMLFLIFLFIKLSRSVTVTNEHHRSAKNSKTIAHKFKGALCNIQKLLVNNDTCRRKLQSASCCSHSVGASQHRPK